MDKRTRVAASVVSSSKTVDEGSSEACMSASGAGTSAVTDVISNQRGVEGAGLWYKHGEGEQSCRRWNLIVREYANVGEFALVGIITKQAIERVKCSTVRCKTRNGSRAGGVAGVCSTSMVCSKALGAA